MDKPGKIIFLAFAATLAIVVWFNKEYLWANLKYSLAPVTDASSLDTGLPADSPVGVVQGKEVIDLTQLLADWQPVGISNSNLQKIPLALIDNSVDADGDGLSDDLEKALGTSLVKIDTDGDGFSDGLEVEYNHDLLGSGLYDVDLVFAAKQRGKLFVQVEANGELWYIGADAKRYYVSPASAESYLADKTPITPPVVTTLVATKLPVAATKPTATPATPVMQTELGINTLYVQSLKLKVPVVYVAEATDAAFQKGLESGVVHYPGTVYPGQYGNIYIFGHSSDYRWRTGNYKAVFAVLPQIKVGAEVILTSPKGEQFKYEVFASKAVSATDTKYLGQYNFERQLLTLQTSWPIGTALKRWVVIAELVN